MIAAETRTIYCCQCERDVEAVLTTGAKVYPRTRRLHALPFWCCPTCGNYVGCHHKTRSPTKPLGVIPTPQMRDARILIHTRLDALWRGNYYTRGLLYKRLARALGRDKYHTAELRSMEEVERVLAEIEKLRRYVINHGKDTLCAAGFG